ncbi:GTP-binding protein [Streptomyces sp. AcH 505]|uniref:GTP-binding protein n=1 Tax=Streptomyces sp. AcH 505 TaxID=352211 RepID=UPI0005A76477
MSGIDVTATLDLIPVTVLTGFLGSGKTTVLNRLLRQPGLDRTIAIINEFGEVGIDHLLIETSEERFALLDNGCICCTVRGDLAETLKRLVTRRAVGELPPFDRILIETTGLADPAPVLHTLMVDPDVARFYRIDTVVVTIDAVNGEATLRNHTEAVKQAAVADRLLMTKTDLVDRPQVDRLAARLAAINPSAQLLSVRDGQVNAADILGAGVLEPAAHAADVVAWFDRAAAAEHDSECSDTSCGHSSHGHHHDASRHGHGIQSFSLLIDDPLAWGPFAGWLDYLASLKGEDLLRFKGLVDVAETPDHPVVVHGVQHVFHPPRQLAAWPSVDRGTRLVFIVREIPRALIVRTLGKFAGIDADRIRDPRQGATARHRKFAEV